eukprot:TRINITY_DN8898_c0_g1_i2.p1 TRINITY_DN8898_c0_g1~~TRINITY_DN8898_c0_g1_i2.p1  ORF type:complete len:115 (+),score=27.93 TRINITY_DN8898_c0_g1_i2:276-620(+)
MPLVDELRVLHQNMMCLVSDYRQHMSREYILEFMRHQERTLCNLTLSNQSKMDYVSAEAQRLSHHLNRSLDAFRNSKSADVFMKEGDPTEEKPKPTSEVDNFSLWEELDKMPRE